MKVSLIDFSHEVSSTTHTANFHFTVYVVMGLFSINIICDYDYVVFSCVMCYFVWVFVYFVDIWL